MIVSWCDSSPTLRDRYSLVDKICSPTFHGSPTVSEHCVSSRLALSRRGAWAIPAVTPHPLHHVRFFGYCVCHDGSGTPWLWYSPFRGAARELYSVVPEGELTLLWTVSPLPSDASAFPSHCFSETSICETPCNIKKIKKYKGSTYQPLEFCTFYSVLLLPVLLLFRYFLTTVTSEEGSIWLVM